MEGWKPFGDPTRPSKVWIEEPIEIQWTDPVRRGRRAVATELEPEPEPEPDSGSVWSDDNGDDEAYTCSDSWQGQHPALGKLSGATLGEVLARASDTRSLEQVLPGATHQAETVPPFPSAGPEREVVDWLGRAGLAMHAQALVGAGLTSMEHCTAVTPEDLAAAGMTGPEMESFYAALREYAPMANGEVQEENAEQDAVVSTAMAGQRDQLLQLLPDSMRTLYEQRTLAANVASMSQPSCRTGPPLERPEGLPSAAELEAAAAQPDDLWADAEPAVWDAEDATPANWDDEQAEVEDATTAEEARKQAAFAGEDDPADEEIDEEALQAEVVRLQAEVDRWQQAVTELADAGDARTLERMRSSLFADAEGDLPGKRVGTDIDMAVDAMSAAQTAMQQRLGKLTQPRGKVAKESGGSKAPPMMVMRPMSGPK